MAFDDASAPSSEKTFQQGLDEMRQHFVATFVAQCDALRILVDEVAALHPRGPVASAHSLTHRLSGLAGTIGFPTISARASDLENLVAFFGGRGDFGMLRPRARPWTRSRKTPWRRTWPRSPPVEGRGESSPPGNSPAGGQSGPPVSRVCVPSRPFEKSFIVDDHAMVRRGLRAVLSEEFPGAAFGEAADASQAVEQLRQRTVGTSCCSTSPCPERAVWSSSGAQGRWPGPAGAGPERSQGRADSPFASLKAGAGGYVTKESAPEELAKAVRKVRAGGRYVSPRAGRKTGLGRQQGSSRTRRHETLSDRGYDVMSRIASGRTVTKSPRTSHSAPRRSAPIALVCLEKLGVKNSAEIVQYAIRNGLVT